MLPDVAEHGALDHHAMVEAKIVRMANQIATYFNSQPEVERAAGIASHINDFWEPRMRKHLFEIADQTAGQLNETVRQAMILVKRPT